MSKSDTSDQSRINLTDDADAIVAKIRRAKTDAAPLPTRAEELKDRPEADNLVGIHAALLGQSKARVLEEFGGEGFGQRFKPALADLLAQTLAPVSDRMRRLMADPGEIDRVLADGAERARALAAPVLADTRRIVGLWAREVKRLETSAATR